MLTSPAHQEWSIYRLKTKLPYRLDHTVASSDSTSAPQGQSTTYEAKRDWVMTVSILMDSAWGVYRYIGSDTGTACSSWPPDVYLHSLLVQLAEPSGLSLHGLSLSLGGLGLRGSSPVSLAVVVSHREERGWILSLLCLVWCVHWWSSVPPVDPVMLSMWCSRWWGPAGRSDWSVPMRACHEWHSIQCNGRRATERRMREEEEKTEKYR